MYDLWPTDGTQDTGMPAPGMTQNTWEWEHFWVFHLKLLGPHPSVPCEPNGQPMVHGDVGPLNDTEHLGMIPFLVSRLDQVGPHPSVLCESNG